MRFHHSLFVLLFVVFSANLVHSSTLNRAQESKLLVEAVEVLGNRHFTQHDILQHVKTRPGQIYNAEQIQSDLEAILKLGKFEKTQTRVKTETGRRGGIVVMFEIMELPIIKGVVFEGLKNISESEIRRLLQSEHVNIEKGAVYNPVDLQKGMRLIKEYLEAHHWSEVNVTASENIGEKPDEVTLTLIIEGKDYAIIDVAHNNDLQRTRTPAGLLKMRSRARR